MDANVATAKEEGGPFVIESIAHMQAGRLPIDKFTRTNRFANMSEYANAQVITLRKPVPA